MKGATSVSRPAFLPAADPGGRAGRRPGQRAGRVGHHRRDWAADRRADRDRWRPCSSVSNPRSPLGLGLRFATDVISGVPSIVMGIFAYTLIVLPQRHFSALAGGVVLAFIMLPTIIRTTEEMIRLVPPASLAKAPWRWAHRNGAPTFGCAARRNQWDPDRDDAGDRPGSRGSGADAVHRFWQPVYEHMRSTSRSRPCPIRFLSMRFRPIRIGRRKPGGPRWC